EDEAPPQREPRQRLLQAGERQGGRVLQAPGRRRRRAQGDPLAHEDGAAPRRRDREVGAAVERRRALHVGVTLPPGGREKETDRSLFGSDRPHVGVTLTPDGREKETDRSLFGAGERPLAGGAALPRRPVTSRPPSGRCGPERSG